MVIVAAAMMMAQAGTTPVRPGFPGCPPDAVSSLCAPPPPPPPRVFDDAAMGERFASALRDYQALRMSVDRALTVVRQARPSVVDAPIASPAWEAQRARISALLAIEKRISRLQVEAAAYAEQRRTQASAGDTAEFDRLWTMIEDRRRKMAPVYVGQMRVLLERPEPGSRD